MSKAHVYEFADDDAFYRAMHDALTHARDTIYLTHMQDRPPRGYNIQSPYFLDLLRYASENPQINVRRIISITNDSMAAWAEQQLDDMADIPNFEVRVIEKPAQFPWLNMAILDWCNIFLSNSDRINRQSAAIWIYNDDLGAFYANYHESLWGISIPLDIAIDRYYKRRDRNR